MSTAETIKSIIANHLHVHLEKVVDNASIRDDLGADSLDLIEMVMTIEEEYRVEIPDEIADTILIVSDAVKVAEKAILNARRSDGGADIVMQHTEIASPAGERIRSAQDEAMETASTTSQPLVGAVSTHPIQIGEEDAANDKIGLGDFITLDVYGVRIGQWRWTDERGNALNKLALQYPEFAVQDEEAISG